MANKTVIGIIGGTGVYNLDSVKIIKEHDIDTPFGKPSDPVIEAEMNGAQFFFIARHGKDHRYLPHEVNYRANVFALKSLGAQYLISVSAVGSLKEELPPKTFVMPDQFIDWTKGKRERSFFGNGVIGHISCAMPVELKLQELMVQSCKKAGVKHSVGGSYICIEGPQFSSKAESAIYRSFGASVIGMTNVPESYLAKEAGMAYATIAMVTDYDCWKEEHCSIDEIIKVDGENNKAVQNVLADLLPTLDSNPFDFVKENGGFAIMTPKEKMTAEQKSMVKVLLS